MTRLLMAVALVAIGFVSPLRASDPLSLVPGDAALFVHLDVTKVMAGPIGASLRSVEIDRPQDDFDRKPGDPSTPKMKPYGEIRDKFLKATGIDVESIKSATLWMPKLKGPGDESTTVLALTFAKPYDQEKLIKGLGEFDERYQKPKIIGVGMIEYPGGLRLGFPNDTTIFVMGPQVKSMPMAVENSSGVIAPAIAVAKSGTMGVVSVNFDQFPEEIKGDELPAEVRPFAPLIKSDLNYATFEQKGEMIQAVVRVRNRDKVKTDAAEKALENLITFAKTGLAVASMEIKKNEKDPEIKPLIGLVASLQEMVKTARYERDDNEARLSLSMKADSSLTGTLVALTQRIQGASSRSITQNNLKQVGLALHNYESAMGHFPAAAICSKDGKPLLSWRVAILPYIEQDALYRQFKLDEPWDSEHNKKLAEYVVKVYTIPGQADPKLTHLRTFADDRKENRPAFGRTKTSKILDITDGSSNTIWTVYAKEAVIWTKPESLTLDMKKNPAELLLFQNDVTNVGFADGSVRSMSKQVLPEQWRALLTANGGEVVNP